MMTPSNDWKFKKSLWISLAILLASLGLIGLAALSFDIPILRQIEGSRVYPRQDGEKAYRDL